MCGTFSAGLDLREGVNRESDAIAYPHLAHKASYVRLDRTFVDTQGASDSAVG